MMLPWSISNSLAQDIHDHDNDHQNEQNVTEEHSADCDHDHGSDHNESSNEADHDDHGDELIVELSREAIQLVGINVSFVEQNCINNMVDLPGEVGFNEDRLTHIAPRFEGVALNVNCRVGDYVDKGKIVATIESNESMTSYSIKAPMSGWVIERSITPGEFVSAENSIFVIADLSTVWVNLAVYSKDANRIKKGQIATIKAIGSENNVTGEIEYVTPIMDIHTRSLTARVTLPNPNNMWRPGSFVEATVAAETGDETLVVEKEAVQYLDGRSVIFVVEGPTEFKPVEIEIGDNDFKYIQVKSGLTEGTRYVTQGAFELKAKIVTSNLDAHAGHGH
jgi:cobalt-zinc-cadmium efflux system membrane fusion protein